MEERDGIPEDIMETAEKMAEDMCSKYVGYDGPDGHEVADAIARAIWAERKKCAQMVKEGIRLNKVVVRRTGEQEPYTILIGDEELADAIRNP